MSVSNSNTNRFFCAVDSFKETISSTEIALIIKDMFSKENITLDYLPISDGGEGLIKALEEPLSLKITKCQVTGPDHQLVYAEYGYDNETDTLVVEMAAASGLPLIKDENRNPLLTTTYGTGELIRKGIRPTTKKLLLGVGGSATSDAGLGALQALGVEFNQLNHIASAKDLKTIDNFKLPENHILKNVEIIIACDVNNPFTGPQGAAFVYGPQKCSSKMSAKEKNETIHEIEDGMKHFQELILNKKQIDLSKVAGAGAAGGISGTFMAFFGAILTPGSDLIFKTIEIERHISNSDIIITGEGCLDEQTAQGKVVSKIVELAQKHSKKVIGIFGQSKLNDKQTKSIGIEKVYCLIEDSDLDTCLNKTESALRSTAARLIREVQ